MPGFTKNLRGAVSDLFGLGADGDAVITGFTPLPSVENGEMVVKEYTNLTINPGAILTVSNRCNGLLLRVRGLLTLIGDISMTGKAPYIPGGGSDLYFGYADIKIPALGAAGAPAVGVVMPWSQRPGVPGADGIDGQCGGGGGGAGLPGQRLSAGAAGYAFGGGCGGSGGVSVFDNGHLDQFWGDDARPYGERGGNPKKAHAYSDEIGDWINFWGKPGACPGGGILIVMARRIIGNGRLLANGLTPVPGTQYHTCGSGASGGGSILVYYGTADNLQMNADGGQPGKGYRAPDGGRGGRGSCRAYSLAELARHTRI